MTLIDIVQNALAGEVIRNGEQLEVVFGDEVCEHQGGEEATPPAVVLLLTHKEELPLHSGVLVFDLFLRRGKRIGVTSAMPVRVDVCGGDFWNPILPPQ